ncbi:serine hydrolase domain-containing protein [Microbacterium sp.]|uniref:serine hydrolase domain-containing protein n=1 Tax=Microbacterium sp. TaxID=51671 RepID=UPI0039E3182D
MKARRLIAAASVAASAAAAVWAWRNQSEIATRRPINEWTFTHMNRVMPTESAQAPAHATPLPHGAPMPPVTYSFEGETCTLPDLHRRTHTTSFVVLHRGRIVAEEYPGAFAAPDRRFQVYSLTKSVTSMLFGIALERGEIASIDDPVVTYRPELAGTGYDGPTIGHLLNMTSGVGELEDWTVRDSPINRFQDAVTTGGSILDVIRSLPVRSKPGEAFLYSTIDTHVLGWVLEAATGRTLAQYASEHLLGPIGAEHDAYYFLSRGRPRTALGGGSLNITTRDLARIGLLAMNEGRAGETQVVPAPWVARSRGADIPHLDVGALGASGYPHYGYSNLWWTLGGEHRAFTGLGVHGQYLWVDPDREVVIAKTSAWTTADDEARDRETVAALTAIVEALDTL